jgi:CelD/BcsL family acetyltransferase involved in cellulose biosynthesis
MAGRARRKLKAQWMKARQMFNEVRVLRVRPTPSEVDGVVSSFVAIEGSGWKAQNQSSLSHQAELREFFTRYFTCAAKRGRLTVSTLLFDDAAAAMECAVVAYRRSWQLKIAYDERVAKLGPGVLLTDASIRAACAEGLEAYEFLGSAERWQDRWGPDTRHYRTAVVYPLRARSMLTAAQDMAVFLSRRLSTGGRFIPVTA